MILKTPQQIFRNGVSPSMINTWTTCKRKWYNKYIRGWKEDDSASLIIGRAIDQFWNNWHDPKNPIRNLEVLKKNFREIFTKEDEVERPRYTITQKQGEKIIDMYGEQYPIDTEPFKVHEMQKQITIPVKGLNLKLNTILDGSIEFRGGLWVFENKTGGVNRQGKFDLDFQPIVTMKALNELTGRKVEGVFYNEVYLYKEITKKNFHRHELTKTQDQMEYHFKQFCNIANSMVEYVQLHWEDVEKFPLEESQMNCLYCPFKDICIFNDNTNLWEGDQK